MSLLKLTSIYNTFSNLGEYYEPTTITKIQIDNKTSYLRMFKPESKLNKSSCFILNELLTGVFDTNLNHVNQVTGTKIANQLEVKCAAKTGLTDYDAYIIGFNPFYTIGIWVGNTDNTFLIDAKDQAYPKQLFAKIINYLGEENKNISEN